MGPTGFGRIGGRLPGRSAARPPSLAGLAGTGELVEEAGLAFCAGDALGAGAFGAGDLGERGSIAPTTAASDSAWPSARVSTLISHAARRRRPFARSFSPVRNCGGGARHVSSGAAARADGPAGEG